MPTTSAISEAIALVLEGVPDIGTVNRYDRFFTDEPGFREFHTAEIAGRRIIASATITATGIAPLGTKAVRDGNVYVQTKRRSFEVKIMRGQEDAAASQHTLADLADDVFDALDGAAAREALGALGYVYEPPEVTTIGMAAYGGTAFTVLVNQAIVVINLDEVLS